MANNFLFDYVGDVAAGDRFFSSSPPTSSVFSPLLLFSSLFLFFFFFEKLSYYQRTILKYLFEEEETRSVSEIFRRIPRVSMNWITEIKFLRPIDARL